MADFLSKKIEFSKMHGAGNDYVYFDWRSPLPSDLKSFARRVSNRNFGIGSDGIVVILPSEVADFRMRMFNADGSEAEMCGNASRCVAKYLIEHHLTDKSTISLETLAGIKSLRARVDELGRVDEVAVDMGKAAVSQRDVEVGVGDMNFITIPVDMGNPHAVVIGDDLSDSIISQYGPLLETAPVWPQKANIEFVRVDDSGRLTMRVWERGSGETLACGTGACAAVAACFSRGLCSSSVTVNAKGGLLTVSIDPATYEMTLRGGAVEVARGEIFTGALQDAPQQN